MPIARFVCVVCCRSLSEHPGICRACGVQRLALDRSDVREEIHTRLEALLEKEARQTRILIGVAATLFAIPASLGAGWWIGPYLSFSFRLQIVLLLAAGGCVGWGASLVMRVIYVRLKPQSAEAILATRAAKSGDNELFLRAHGTAAARLDPRHADPTEVLRAFGATFD